MTALPPQHAGQGNTMLICEGPDVIAEECGHWFSPDAVQKMILAEREACAKVCDEMSDWPFEKYTSTTIKSHDYQVGIVRGLVNATNAIRARSKT